MAPNTNILAKTCSQDSSFKPENKNKTNKKKKKTKQNKTKQKRKKKKNKTKTNKQTKQTNKQNKQTKTTEKKSFPGYGDVRPAQFLIVTQRGTTASSFGRQFLESIVWYGMIIECYYSIHATDLLYSVD